MTKKSKVPVLRKGLTVDQLLAGTWLISENRYVNDDELIELSDRILRAVCQGLIDEADSGGRVTRRAIINTLPGIGNMLLTAKDHIIQKMGEGVFTPTLLDEIANV